MSGGYQRLSDETAARLPESVARPRYDRARTGTGIVHLGVGAFHKAHQAVYTDDALAEAGGDWAIVGVSLRRPDARDQLVPQDGLFVVGAREAEGEARRLVGALKSVLVAPEDPRAVVTLIADPRIKVATLTITEKGYCLDPQTGALDMSAQEIAHDLAAPDAPRSAIGILVEALRLRKAAGAAAPAIVACDNLAHNGARLRRAVLDFARARDAALGDWIENEAAFPSTMVDRIVPATTTDDLDEAARTLGLYDAAYVKTEPFSQWVIEDAFPGGRPLWEAGGAVFVSDVAPYETMKLRLLNGAHSAMAYLGYLAGHEHISDVVADNDFRRYVTALMTDEIKPTVPKTQGVELDAYIGELLERFSNPALLHRTWQIAMDGSQKLPQRWVGTISERLAAGLPIDRLALALAGWMRYVRGDDEKGAPIDVRDPLAAQLREKARASGTAREKVAALLSIRQVFGDDLPHDPRIVEAVAASLEALDQDGAAAAVRASNLTLQPDTNR